CPIRTICFWNLYVFRRKKLNIMRNLLVVLCLVLSSFVWSQTEWNFNRMISPDGQEYLVRGKVTIGQSFLIINVNGDALELYLHKSEMITVNGTLTVKGSFTDSVGDLVYVYVPKEGIEMMIIEVVRTQQFLIFFNEEK